MVGLVYLKVSSWNTIILPESQDRYQVSKRTYIYIYLYISTVLSTFYLCVWCKRPCLMIFRDVYPPILGPSTSTCFLGWGWKLQRSSYPWICWSFCLTDSTMVNHNYCISPFRRIGCFLFFQASNKQIHAKNGLMIRMSCWTGLLLYLVSWVALNT